MKAMIPMIRGLIATLFATVLLSTTTALAGSDPDAAPVAQQASPSMNDAAWGAADAAAKAREWAGRLEAYKRMGGVAYKSGLVQRAEAELANFQRAAAGPKATTPLSPEAERYHTLAARYRAMGGIAYKTGLVQAAEAQARRYEAPIAATSPVLAPEVAHPPFGWGKPVELFLPRTRSLTRPAARAGEPIAGPGTRRS